MAKIAIIGGGVIGSAIAYYLALAGYAADVVVIEPDPTYEFAATPRATGGIRQLFTVPENIRMAQYGHEIYGQFETLMAVDGNPAPIDFHRRLFVARFRKARHRFADRQLADPNRARRPGRIARPQGRQAPLAVNAG
jgi:glycine/D-amino acid oxidase-like deaminating enzyme